ncbi:MAG: hypothetical protein ACREDL_22740 [Bradyrhizobium sp.]
MLTRALGALALTIVLSPGAFAGGYYHYDHHYGHSYDHPGIVHRMSCAAVRYYVARYSASTAVMWARSHGASDAEIDAARHCLRGAPAQTAQARRWYTPSDE